MPIESKVQTTITQYFKPIQNLFEEIINLHENLSNFRIRCKIIYKSPVRYFGNGNKLFDGIICDETGEAKIVAFNQNVDKFYDTIITNKTIKIENGKIELIKEKYRSTYSIYQIQLLSNTIIEPYNSSNFRPLLKINKESLINISKKRHGSTVDVQGKVVFNEKPKTTISQKSDKPIQRKTIKIKDETSTATVTIWSNKVTESLTSAYGYILIFSNDLKKKQIDELPNKIINKTLQIRNGRINHYGDYVSINVNDQTILSIID